MSAVYAPEISTHPLSVIGRAQKQELAYRPDIDGLRAIAVVLVLLFHAGLGISGGFVGVDVFFVISGYLISGSITGQWSRNSFSLLTFYDHRVRRIFPALFVMLATTSIVAYIWMLPGSFSKFSESLIATATSTSNIYFWKSINYFQAAAGEVPLLHTWSLGVEEQFYVLFPAFLVLILRLPERWRTPAIAVATLTSLALSLWALPRMPGAAFYLLPMRAWELLLGCLISRPLFIGARLSAQAGDVCCVLGLGLIGWSAATLMESSPFPGAAAVPPTLGAALVIYGGRAGPGAMAPRLLASLPFRAIGLISYSLYLWHWPVLVAFRLVTGSAAAPAMAIALLCFVAAISAASWRFVEQPFRRRDPKGRTWLGPVTAVVAIVVTSAAGGLVVFSNGWAGRLPAEVQRIASFAEKDAHATSCTDRTAAQISNGDLCAIGAPAASRTWLLWGDSHGWALQDAVSKFLTLRGEAGVVATQLGCPPMTGYRSVGISNDCKTASDATLLYAKRHGVTDVLIVSVWTNWFGHHDHFIDDKTRVRSVADTHRVLTEALADTLNEFHKAGIRVWVVDPLPQAKASVPEALVRELRLGQSHDLEYSRAEYETRNRLVFDVLAKNRALIYARIRLQDALCASGACVVRNADGPLYLDQNHPAKAQAAYFAALMAENARRPNVSADDPEFAAARSNLRQKP